MGPQFAAFQKTQLPDQHLDSRFKTKLTGAN